MPHSPARQHPEDWCAMGRVAQIDEFDGALLFLASDASAYCNGLAFAINEGWAIR